MTRGAGPGSSMTPARGAAEGGAEGAYEPPEGEPLLFRSGGQKARDDDEDVDGSPAHYLRWMLSFNVVAFPVEEGG